MKQNVMRVVFLITIVFLVIGCTTTPQEQPDIESELQQMIALHFGQLQEAQHLPPHLGMMLHMITPEKNVTVYAGFEGVQVSEHTHYRVASVSKTITAAAIMVLTQEGKLTLDDPVSWYIEDDIPYKEDISIRDLLAHRAGVFDLFNDPIPVESQEAYAGMNYIQYTLDTKGDDYQFTLSELLSILAINDLYYAPPKEISHYSDVGYMILAGIIEHVSGSTYEQYVKDTLFIPLGLFNSSAPYKGTDQSLPIPYFEGYTRWDGDYFITTEDNMSCQVGPGNIVSTPSDMARWMRELLSGRGPVAPEYIEKMKEIPPGNTSYALGISRNSVGFGHSGAHPGYMNLVTYNQEHDISLVVCIPFIDYNEGNMNNIMEILTVMNEVSQNALFLVID